jgi:hypothetical protein
MLRNVSGINRLLIMNKEKKNGYFTGDFTGPSSGSGF